MKHSFTQLQLFLLLCCLTGSLSGLRAEIPYVNDLVSHDHPTSTQLFNADEPIPFLGAILQARTDQQFAGQVMMPCLDILTVGDDETLCFGDTATLIGLAVEGVDTFQGTWFVLQSSGSGLDDDGTFTNVDGSPASELIIPGSNLYESNSVSGRDTIRFSRGMMDNPNRTDYLVVFTASGSCGTAESDTILIRFDLEPNLTLDINSGGTTQSLEAGAFPVGASLSGAYCSGADLEMVPSVINNPTLSGKPVFLRVELVDTAGIFGFGMTPAAGDTFNIPLPAFEVDTILQNLGDEDKVASIKLRPYHETDGAMTDPNSTYNEGIDIIGDSIEFDLVIFSEPIASFGGNDTICYGSNARLDFTGTPNTRVYYRDTITMTIDSVDLDALGNSMVTFGNVTTDLYFVIDSLVRLVSPFCSASPATIAGIAAQPFSVLDSIVAEVMPLDTIACDTFETIDFDFIGANPSSNYSFAITNNVDNSIFNYMGGNGTYDIDLAAMNFGGQDSVAVTFFLQNVDEVSGTISCFNPGVQDSFVVFVDPEPVAELIVGTNPVSTNLNLTSTQGNAAVLVGDPAPSLNANCDIDACGVQPLDINSTLISVSFTGTHPFVSDLIFYLQAPDGTTITLLSENFSGAEENGGDDFTNLTFTNGAGGDIDYLTATTPLTGTFNSSDGVPIDWSVLNGQNLLGNWKLIVADYFFVFQGNLDQAVLTFADDGSGTSGIASPIVYDSGAGFNQPILDGSGLPNDPNSAMFNTLTTTANWYNAMAGGSFQGSGNLLNVAGTTAEEGPFTTAIPGTYTYYVECECNGVIQPRVERTVVVSQPVTSVLQDTFCITSNVNITANSLSTPVSGRGEFSLVSDTLFEADGMTVISFETYAVPTVDLTQNTTLAPSGPDTVLFTRTIRPYFEATPNVSPADFDAMIECDGGIARLEILLTPAPLQPLIAFSTDTICEDPNNLPEIDITGGTPGASVTYSLETNGVNNGAFTETLDPNGEFTTTYTPLVDSGSVIVRLQSTFADCNEILSQSDTLVIKPQPQGMLTVMEDSICLSDTAYVVFNTDFNYEGIDSFELRFRAYPLGDTNGPATDVVVRDGDTIFADVLPDDFVFEFERLRYVNGQGCRNPGDFFDTIWVDNEPQLEIDLNEVSISPLTMATVTTDPMGNDSIYVETCAADSLFLDYGVPNAMTDTSQFNDSLYVALTIVDPLGVTPAGIGTNTVYFDIDEPGAYDTLSLINNTNDTARIELTAIPFFYDAGDGLSPADAFAESCTGDTLKITIDVINNFVSTIGGNYIVCTGVDTSVLITGPDFATVQYVAITADGMGDFDTSAVRTVTLDNLGRFEIEIDSILQDTTYDLIAANLPATSGCAANLGPNITVSVIPVPVATFDSTSLMICEGASFSTTLMGPPEGFARITNNVNGDSEFVSFNDDSVAIFMFDSLVGDITFYVDSIINDTTGLNPVCVTDTITDSLVVIQIVAPTAELVTDTICFGDTAYVTFSTPLVMDSFNIEILVDGIVTALSDVKNADTVAVLNGLTADSTAVFLQSAQILNSSMCAVLPLDANIDTAYVRVDTLPQLSTTFTEPFDLTVDASTVNDSIVMCYDEVVTNTITIDPFTSIAGNDAMVFGNAVFRIGSGPSSPVPGLPANFSVDPAALEFTAFDFNFLNPGNDSLVVDFEVLPYFPSSPNAAYNPMTDCAGDTATFTLIVLPQPTANFNFANNPICESETTPITIMGSAGDTVLFAVEGLGTFNVVIPADGSFEYMMPSVDSIEAAILANTGMANDDQIAFAIVNVLSATNPSCDAGGSAFAPLSVDFLDLERLMRVDLMIVDTTVCTGSDAVLNFSGTPGASFEATFDYADDNLDNEQTLTLNGMGELTVTIMNFRDTLTVSIDSVFSGSALMCLDTSMIDTFPTIRAIPLPDANFGADTVCNNGMVDVVFNYTGLSTAASGDTFEVNYTDQNGMAQLDTLEDEELIATLTGSGTYTFTILSVTDLQTGCDTIFPGGGLEQTFVIEDAPAFQVEFTGGVNNGVVFDTDMPFTFPNPGITSVCSGTNLTTEVIGMNSSSAGDPTYARLIITQDPLGVFGPGAIPRTEFVPLSVLELNTLLVNNTASVQNIAFSWTAYYETNPASPDLDVDECIGGTQNFLIRVAPNPQAEFTNMDTMRVCRGDDLYIKFNGTEGAEVTFSDDNGNTYSSIVGPNDSLFFDTDLMGPDTIRFGVDLVEFTFPLVNLTCTSTPIDSFTLIINEFREVGLDFMANDTICFNEDVEVVFLAFDGVAPYDVTVNGMNFTDVRDGDTLFNSGPLMMNTTYTISAATDSNGCSIITPFVDSVEIDEVPLLTSTISTFDLTNSFIGSEDHVDGLYRDTLCSLERFEVSGSTATAMNLAGDDLYVQVEITGDVNGVYPAYIGDQFFNVPLSDLGTVLNSPAIVNNGNTSLDVQIILTPYFESNPGAPALDGAECAGAMDTIQITIDPRPNANPTFYEFDICSRDTFTFDLSTAIDNFQAGTTFSYTTSSTGDAMATPRPVASEEDIEDVPVNISANRDTVTYIVTPFSPGGCEGGTFEIEVIVRPEPVLIANTQTICSNSESMLEVTNDAGVINPNSYIVTDVVFDMDSLTAIDVITVGDTFARNNPGMPLPGEDNLFIRDEFVNMSFDTQRVDYFLVPLRNQTGCTGDTVTFSLFIAPEPVVMDRDTVVCTDVRLGINLQDYIDNDVESDISWFVFDQDFLVVILDGTGSGSATGDAAVITDSIGLLTSAGTQNRRITYQVDVTGTNGCPTAGPSSFLLDVFVSPQIQLTLNAPDGDFICNNEAGGGDIIVQGVASNTIGDVNYDWSITDVDPGVVNPTIINPSGNGSSIGLEATGNGQFTINLAVTDEGGCDAMTSQTITVYDELVASFDTMTVGLSTVDFFDTSEGFPTQWMWTFDDPTTGNADTSMVENPTHTFSAPGTYDVTLTVIRQTFCPDTATVTQQVFVGFTPVARIDTVILNQGFNIISFDVDPANDSITSVFADVIANGNLQDITGIDPNSTTQFETFDPNLPPVFNSLNIIRPGYGYLVEMAPGTSDTVFLPGISLDPELRIDLRAGFNFVAYIYQQDTFFNSYFDDLIINPAFVSALAIENGTILNYDPNPLFNPLDSLQNSLGYVIETNASLDGSVYRSDEPISTSNFEFLYGYTDLTEAVGQRIDIMDEDRNYRGHFVIGENGILMPRAVFGDLELTAEVEGMLPGTKLLFEYNNQLLDIDYIFQGDWSRNLVELNFTETVSSTNELDAIGDRWIISPNPSLGRVAIDFHSANFRKELSIEVMNAYGQVVTTRQFEALAEGKHRFLLDLTKNQSGMYLVRITADGEVIGTKNLILQ